MMDAAMEPVSASAAGVFKDFIPIPSNMKQLQQVERLMIFRALDAHGGNKTDAARSLGVNRRTLYNRLYFYEALDAQDAQATQAATQES